MAPKVMKKVTAGEAPLKSVKPIEKPISKMKKKKKKSYQSFSIYLYKLLHAVTKQKMGISRKSMIIMNDFVNNMLETIAMEACRLVAHGNKTTMSAREIQSSVKLLLPGELAKHANIEGVKALNLYLKNKAQSQT